MGADDKSQVERHDAYLICDPEVAADEVREFKSALSAISSDLEVQFQEPGVQAAAEWALPALVLAILGKPFWDGFIGELVGEAGAGVAKRLKSGVKALFRRLRGREKVWANADQIRAAIKQRESGQEAVVQGSHGPILRIQFLIAEGPGRVVTNFVFLSQLTDEQAEDATDGMIEVLRHGLQAERQQAAVDFLGYFSTTYVYDVACKDWIRT